jgi:integrase
LTIEEEKKLLAEVLRKSKQAYGMAVVALDAGLRFGEIASLTWGCVDQAGGVLRILDTKGGRDRIVPMTDRLKDLFKSMTEGASGELVFPNPKGAAMV